MQDADYAPCSQPEILADFGLSLDPQRFTAPQLAVTSAVVGRIAAGLAARAKDAGLHPKHAARRLRMRRKVLIETVSDLFDAGALAECAHLSAACGALNAPRVAIFWARALENLRAQDDLKALIDRLEADPDLIPRNRRNLLDLRMHNMMGLKAADHRVFVPGEIPATLGAALARLPAPDVQWVAPKLADTLAQIRGLSGAEAEAFKAKLSWGRAAADYLTFLKYYAAPGSGGPLPGTGSDQGGPGDPEVRGLLGQLKALMILPDPNPMVAAAQAGRSIVLTAAHAGLPVVAPWIMTDPGLPLLGISAKSPTDLDNPVDKTLGVHGNFQADFLRAVKLLRRDPHLVQLLPDGGLGGATTQHRFHGVDLPLGQGAAVMAWQARAAVFFFGTRWRDGRLEIYVRTGPVAEKNGDRTVFDRAFYDFYLGCLNDILYGPPEDMAPGGGFWRHLKAGSDGGA